MRGWAGGGRGGWVGGWVSAPTWERQGCVRHGAQDHGAGPPHDSPTARQPRRAAALLPSPISATLCMGEPGASLAANAAWLLAASEPGNTCGAGERVGLSWGWVGGQGGLLVVYPPWCASPVSVQAVLHCRCSTTGPSADKPRKRSHPRGRRCAWRRRGSSRAPPPAGEGRARVRGWAARTGGSRRALGAPGVGGAGVEGVRWRWQLRLSRSWSPLPIYPGQAPTPERPAPLP